MPQLRPHRLEIDARAVGEARRAVAQVVQAHWWQPGLADQMVEAAGQEIQVQRRTVLGDEHVPGVLPALPRRTLLGPLPAPVLAQQADGVPVQCDQPAACAVFGGPTVTR